MSIYGQCETWSCEKRLAWIVCLLSQRGNELSSPAKLSKFFCPRGLCSMQRRKKKFGVEIMRGISLWKWNYFEANSNGTYALEYRRFRMGKLCAVKRVRGETHSSHRSCLAFQLSFFSRQPANHCRGGNVTASTVSVYTTFKPENGTKYAVKWKMVDSLSGSQPVLVTA